MKTTAESFNNELLVALQQGVPLVRRPFAAMGETLGLSEETVLAKVRELFATGVARRFGAVFDSHSLGYASTLCAADIPAEELEAAAAWIAPHPGITHCYERAGHPNLWFTLTAPAAELMQELTRVAAALGGYTVLDLPALRKFKIEAVFGRGEDRSSSRAVTNRSPHDVRCSDRDEDETRSVSARVGPFTECERRVVRCLQGNIAVSEDPFGGVAEELGLDPAKLLALVGRWKETGVIRRVGVIVRHGRLGFSANSMCVWPVAADRMADAGRTMAASSHVTHCYERPASAAFPYNLYAMIHAKTREQAVGIFDRLAAEAGLSTGRMLWSVREFKKASPMFFSETPETGGKRGILFAAPGTTCPEGREGYDRIGRAAAVRFPGVEQRWAYTSGGVRRKLAARGAPVSDPDEALSAMLAEGFTRVAVLSLHLTDGMEYGELAETVESFRRRQGNPVRVVLGQALLTGKADWRRALGALLAALPDGPGDRERVILVVHGSRDPRAEKTLREAARLCREVDRRLILGMMLGTPGLDDVVRECRSAGVKKAWLLPGMVVAGYSAREDIAGAGEQSWASALKHAGIEPVPVVRGLGEVDGVVDIWMDGIERMLAELPESYGPEE